MRDVFLIIASGCAALILESLLISLLNWLLKPKGIRCITLIPIDCDCEILEYRLRWQLFKMETDPFCADNVLLVVDSGKCEEGTEIARRLCRGKRNCRVCKASEIEAIVGRNAICKGIELVLY